MMDVRIRCKVIPGARANELSGVHAGELVARVTAAPEKGKANVALLKLLSRELAVGRSSLAVIQGHASRHKIVSAPADAAGRVRALLEGLA